MPDCGHPRCAILPACAQAPENKAPPPGMSTKQVAAFLGCHRTRVIQYANQGRLPAGWFIGQVRHFPVESVEALKAELEAGPHRSGSKGGRPSSGVPRAVRKRQVRHPDVERYQAPRTYTPLAPSEPVKEKSPAQKAHDDLRRVTLEIARRAQEELRDRCLASLAEFLREGWEVLEPGTPLDWNWHIDAICEHVQRVLEDWAKARDVRTARNVLQNKASTPAQRAAAQATLDRHGADFKQLMQNLLINVPPGTAKSRIVSVYAFAWMWLKHPDWRAICLSANPDVALRDADYALQLIESKWYQETFKPEWQLRADQDAKGNFGNDKGGTRISGGITKKITGLRADAIFVDDPNDAKEVHSEPIRKGVNNAWDQGLRNRLNNLGIGVRIGIMQRLHEEDWSGHVLGKKSKGRLRWVHLCLAMEYEPRRAADDKKQQPGCACTDCQVGHTPLGWSDPRKDPDFLPESAYGPLTGGKVLHPERFPLEVLVDELENLGSIGYAGQQQQRPAPADGIIFKRSWFGEYDDLPERDQGWSMYVDLNAKKTTDGSRTCIMVFTRKGPQRFIVDVFCKITSPAEGQAAVRDMRAKYPKIRREVIEDKANGPAVIEERSRRAQGVIAWSPGSESKESRAVAVQPQVEAGNVFVPRNAAWKEVFFHEVTTFPNGSHDDQVDTFTMALLDMQGSHDAARFLAAYGPKDPPKLSIVA